MTTSMVCGIYHSKAAWKDQSQIQVQPVIGLAYSANETAGLVICLISLNKHDLLRLAHDF